jgi:hypothetical protein
MRVSGANLLLRFLLELCALASLGYWGSQTGPLPVAIVLAVAAPLAAAVLWGAFVAPKASRRLRGARRLVVEIPIFAAAAAGLAAAGQWTLAAIFAAAVVVSELVLYAWSPEES